MKSPGAMFILLVVAGFFIPLPPTAGTCPMQGALVSGGSGAGGGFKIAAAIMTVGGGISHGPSGIGEIVPLYVSGSKLASLGETYSAVVRMVVEETKREAERGKYLSPELYGMPETMRVDHNPELQKRVDRPREESHGE